jgi:5-methylcytosine-specific restriction enzyme subunit McrC
MKMIFEYGNHIDVNDRQNLEKYLCSIWNDTKDLWPDKNYNSFDSKRSYQPFLTFDGDKARANNYIGFIVCNDDVIEIYPKVFQSMALINKTLMHQHLFFWLSYCTKIKFPFTQSFLDTIEIESFPELIIYLMSKQISETTSTQPYLAYEEIEEALSAPRGRINFNRYSKSLAYGTQHLIDCDHEPFVYDNKLNRIIKYCSRLLQTQSKLPETQHILNEICFLLDEVEDFTCSEHDLSNIRIPTLFSAYEDVVQTCKMILKSQIYSHSEYEMKNWSLLLPMEYIFEGFIAGFLKKHFSKDFVVEPQKSELYLHQEPNIFNIQHDVLVTNKATGEQIIIDTKYKPRWNLKEDDVKKDVSQSDMYQMISYAYRRGTKNVLLIYPNTSGKLPKSYVFSIQKAGENEYIKVKVIDVPFWSDHHPKKITDSLFTELDLALRSNFVSIPNN